MIVNVVKLNHELSALRTEKVESAKVMSSFTEEKAKFETQIKELEAKILQLEEANKQAKTEEVAVVTAIAESVEQKVVQKLASIGVPEGIVKEEVSQVSTTPTDIYQQFDALKGKEKIDFFQKNEKVILQAMKALHYAPVNVVKK